MADDRSRAADARQKRVKRLKKYIILTLMLSILIPFVLCIVLMVKVHRINGILTELEARVQELSEMVAAQGQELERIAAEGIVPASGSAPTEGDTAEPDGHPGQSEEADSGTEPESRTGTEAGITAAHKVYLTFDDGPSI